MLSAIEVDEFGAELEICRLVLKVGLEVGGSSSGLEERVE